MVFDKNLTELLNNVWKERKTIKINGANYYGEEFVTEGRISTDDNGKPGFYSEDGVIYLEFGALKENSERNQTSYFAPYNTEAQGYEDFSLFIFSIEIDGEVAFVNPHKEKLLKRGKKALNERMLKLEGRYILTECPVVEELRKMIGKPICLDNRYGVLASLKGVTYSGYPSLDLLMGPVVGRIHVGENSILSTETNDGEVVVLAKNNPVEFENARLEILENITNSGINP